VKPLIAAMLLTLCVCGPVAAREPTGAPAAPDDTFIPPRTPAQAAFERMKLGLVAQIHAISFNTTARSVSGQTATTNMLCSVDCGGGVGGDGSEPDPDEPMPGEGSTSGTTGFIVPKDRVVLAVRARHQSTNYWCGPASGQVVINYSRGYLYENLNGDSATTNWRTQATIAGWMKTNQTTGTLGGNLAAALNRPDAVLRPVPDWAYVYARNTDGEDLHGKVVVDVDHFAMPLVIAVKPHKADAEYFLPSWPREASGAKHWIVIFGYDGLWDGTEGPTLYYTESAGNGSKNPGVYTVSSMAMWKVNQANASTIVW
jgi:hypothetical protein